MKPTVAVLGLLFAVVFALGAVTVAFDIQNLRAGISGASYDILGEFPFFMLLLVGAVVLAAIGGIVLWVAKS